MVCVAAVLCADGCVESKGTVSIVCPISKMVLDEFEIDIGQCLSLLDRARQDDISEKLRERCLKHLVLSLRLLADTLDMALDTETSNIQQPHKTG
jgi:hypothetical protein